MSDGGPLVLIIETKELPTNANPAIQSVIDNYTTEHNLTNWDAAELAHLVAAGTPAVLQE